MERCGGWRFGPSSDLADGALRVRNSFVQSIYHPSRQGALLCDQATQPKDPKNAEHKRAGVAS